MSNFESELYSFGAFSEKFSTQCEGYGHILKHPDLYDRMIDNIVFLHIHNVLTDSRYDECLKRVMNMAKKDFKEQSK